MTQSIDHQASAAASATNEWLSAFQAAVTARDAEAAAALFADESYWRDIISFTWNITTVEGRAGVADLLRATLDEIDPVGFRVSEEPTEADGVITAWIAFETRTGRGSGLLRLIRGEAFTLLTTEPGPEVAPIHNCQVAILDRAESMIFEVAQRRMVAMRAAICWSPVRSRRLWIWGKSSSSGRIPTARIFACATKHCFPR